MAAILVVDDAAFSRRMISKLLREDGHEVIEAESGASALDTIETQHPDLMLVDLLMPDLNGFELIEALRQRQLLLPTIIVSADIQETNRQRGEDLGVVAFLHKPPRQEELRQAVQIGLSQEQQRLQQQGGSGEPPLCN